MVLVDYSAVSNMAASAAAELAGLVHSAVRLSTARAFARRITVLSCCSCVDSGAVDPWEASLERALAMAFRVQIAEGPHPPDGSPTIGLNSNPCDAQSSAVFR